MPGALSKAELAELISRDIKRQRDGEHFAQELARIAEIAAPTARAAKQAELLSRVVREMFSLEQHIFAELADLARLCPILELLREQLEAICRLWNGPPVDKLIWNGNEIVRPADPVQQQRLAVAMMMGGLTEHFIAQRFEPKLLAPLDWVKTAAIEAFKGTRHPLFAPEMPHSRPLEPLIASKTVAGACVLVRMALGAKGKPSQKKVTEVIADKLNAAAIRPPDVYTRRDREKAAQCQWSGGKLLDLWQEMERVSKTPRQARPKGQATIRREFYEALLRDTEGLSPLGVVDAALSYLVEEQNRVR